MASPSLLTVSSPFTELPAAEIRLTFTEAGLFAGAVVVAGEGEGEVGLPAAGAVGAVSAGAGAGVATVSSFLLQAAQIDRGISKASTEVFMHPFLRCESCSFS